jgi:hypothetical protein
MGRSAGVQDAGRDETRDRVSVRRLCLAIQLRRLIEPGLEALPGQTGVAHNKRR